MALSSVGHERIDRDELTRALQASGAAQPQARLVGLSLRPIGIGHTADTLHLTPTWAEPGSGPATLVAKIPSLDAQSAGTAASLGAYEREARFYAELAPNSSLSLPRFLGVMRFDGEPTGVLLEDLSDLTTLDQLANTPVEVVRRLRQELVSLQAPFWNDAKTAELAWLHRRLGVPIPGILERMERSWATTREYLTEDFDREERELVDRFVAGAGRWAESLDGPFSLTHHDFRIDNMLFDEHRAVVLDWQTVGWGAPMFDVAYLLGTSLDPERRREVERTEIALHVEELASRGVDWSFDEAWEAYRRAAFAVLLMLVPPTGSVKRTERGDAMFRRLIRRGARMALDLGADEFLEVPVR
ncbi:phosphotransferase family protein [Kribbia dieselivorans]|uniref:phosphotransferase family protein n=1 Tax=Kribbia dieselivorans TaxID=331526 RepID=UPI00083912E5|nr:aminoglycoside phosphotransferase family protein [Kribbia dieselivorans]